MSSMNTDQTIVLDTGCSKWVWAVAFYPDGKHFLGGNGDEIRRWRLADGQEVEKQTGMQLRAISVSKWIVCGTEHGASVWDGDMHEKVVDVEGENWVGAVDVSPDSTRFATGTGGNDNKASIWSITSGQRLVGPLEHDNSIMGIRFSPTGELIATACLGSSIQIFDSQTGDKLVTIKIDISDWVGTPLAWSSDGQQIFAASDDNKIRSFNTFTGSLRVESQTLHDGNNGVHSVALAANGKFIATVGPHSISFLDTLTLTRIGPVIKDTKQPSSIAISPDSSRLAAGRDDGKIVIRDLGKILPDLYGPFNAFTPAVQPNDQPSTADGHDNDNPNSDSEQPATSSPLESEGHNEDGDDLLEVEVPASTPAPEFAYDESLASSSDSPEDETPPPGPSHAIPQPDALVVPSTTETRPDGNLDTVKSPNRRWIFNRWLRRNRAKGPASHKPDRRSEKSREPVDRQSPSHSLVRPDTTHLGPSLMAEGKRKRRAVAKTVRRPGNKSRSKTTIPKHPNNDVSRSGGQGAVDAREADPTQQAAIPSQPSAAGVQLTHQEESGYSTVALRCSIIFPTWLLCFRSGTHDGTH